MFGFDEEDAVVEPQVDLLGLEAREVDRDDVAVLVRFDADVGLEPFRGAESGTAASRLPNMACRMSVIIRSSSSKGVRRIAMML